MKLRNWILFPSFASLILHKHLLQIIKSLNLNIIDHIHQQTCVSVKPLFLLFRFFFLSLSSSSSVGQPVGSSLLYEETQTLDFAVTFHLHTNTDTQEAILIQNSFTILLRFLFLSSSSHIKGVRVTVLILFYFCCTFASKYKLMKVG